MAWNLYGVHAKENDLALLIGLRHKYYIIQLKTGETFQSHRGVIKHDELIGLPWGSKILSHNGSPFFLLQPSLSDILRDLKRKTQILYPKDMGFILVSMSIGPGQVVVEAGTGSGALTSVFAYAVGSEGRVISYEARPEFQNMAIENLEKLQLADRVEWKVRDIELGFDEAGVDALFLDVPNPYDYITQVRDALKPGGFFGSILPTTNQVSTLVRALRYYGFAFIEVCEVLLRYYRPEPDRLRPSDRMIAHTGYLIFARPLLSVPGESLEGDSVMETDNSDNDSEYGDA